MDAVSPIIAGYFAAIHTTHAVSTTATDGSAAIIPGASEIRIKDSGSRRFFRGMQSAC
jgi:hypothetical protein